MFFILSYETNKIKFPLKIGKTWSGQLRIMDGWGDWTNTSGSFEYEVVAQETINIKYNIFYQYLNALFFIKIKEKRKRK